jgi:hypothetical protein
MPKCKPAPDVVTEFLSENTEFTAQFLYDLSHTSISQNELLVKIIKNSNFSGRIPAYVEIQTLHIPKIRIDRNIAKHYETVCLFVSGPDIPCEKAKLELIVKGTGTAYYSEQRPRFDYGAWDNLECYSQSEKAINQIGKLTYEIFLKKTMNQTVNDGLGSYGLQKLILHRMWELDRNTQ